LTVSTFNVTEEFKELLKEYIGSPDDMGIKFVVRD
jgi:hypothetical protein